MLCDFWYSSCDTEEPSIAVGKICNNCTLFMSHRKSFRNRALRLFVSFALTNRVWQTLSHVDCGLFLPPDRSSFYHLFSREPFFKFKSPRFPEGSFTDAFADGESSSALSPMHTYTHILSQYVAQYSIKHRLDTIDCNTWVSDALFVVFTLWDVVMDWALSHTSEWKASTTTWFQVSIISWLRVRICWRNMTTTMAFSSRLKCQDEWNMNETYQHPLNKHVDI